MSKDLKSKIIELRLLRKTYFEIEKELRCSRGVISYHCKNANLNFIPGITPQKISNDFLNNVHHYYLTHTIKETAENFKVSITTVKRYVNKKRVKLTDEQRRIKNYNRVYTHRKKIKQKAVDYKGGKCEICDYNKSIWSLQFHHKESDKKEFTISNYSNLSWNKIKTEIEKCILICANCHGELHENKFKLSRNSPS